MSKTGDRLLTQTETLLLLSSDNLIHDRAGEKRRKAQRTQLQPFSVRFKNNVVKTLLHCAVRFMQWIEVARQKFLR
jgi:hypothetical protein